MTTTINGTTGIDKVQDGSIVQADLAPNVVGNGPAFRASRAANSFSVTNNLDTAITGLSTLSDTANCFNASLGRFIPNVAGYYYVSGSVEYGASQKTAQTMQSFIRVNGVRQAASSVGGTAIYVSPNVSTIVYLNGTTDYVELGAYQNSGATMTDIGVNNFSGCLVRAA